MTTDLHAAALAYAAAGLPVFPLAPRSKAPLLSKEDEDGRGFHDATTDSAQIRQWWTETPKANIGIHPPAGLLVVDIDPRAGGDAELRRLLRRFGPLPATWTTRTGSGGWHLWFTTPDRADLRGKLAPGLDLKAHTKGYLVAPPSVHPNGQRYHWVTPPHDAPAAAPLWLREAVKPPRPTWPTRTPARSGAGRGRFTLQCLLARIDKAPEGRRNITLYGALKDALSDGNLDAFEPALADAATHRGLTNREVATTVASVRRSSAPTTTTAARA